MGYWDDAGKVGYKNMIFASERFGTYLREASFKFTRELIREINISKNGRALDLGCGDGDLSAEVLSKEFDFVKAIDISAPAIDYAKKRQLQNVSFEVGDICQFNELKISGGKWHCVFMMGILHHVKENASQIVNNVSKLTDYVIVQEPNGNNIGRKLLELLPAYRAAGENSFHKKDLLHIFESNGYFACGIREFNIFPNMTPEFIYSTLKRLNYIIEMTPLIQTLCTIRIFAFKKHHCQS